MLGPALGGALLALIGPGMVFAANAVSFVLSAALVATVRGRFAEDRGEASDEHRGLRAGFVFIARDRVLRTLVFAWCALVLGIGIAMVADVPLAEVFGAGSAGYGLMIGAWGAGSVLGSLAGRKLHEETEGRALVVGSALIGITTAGIALSSTFWPVLALLLLSGAADAVIMVADRSIQQRRTPDAVRSRVVSASEAMVTLALTAGFALGGPVVELVGARGAYAIGGVGGLVGAAVLLPVLRASRGERAGAQLAGIDDVQPVPARVAG
jgi:MFS family permease